MTRFANNMVQSDQMDLFAYQAKPVIPIPLDSESAIVEWSYSRRQLLEQCPWTYYNKYYGANLLVAKNEPRKSQLHFLKSLSNRHQRTGKILHLMISSYLKHTRDGDPWQPDRLLRWAREMYYEDLRFSREFQRGSYLVPGNQNSPVLLAEFYYEWENAEALWKESQERMHVALNTFFTNPDLEQFRIGASRRGSLIEKRVPIRDEHFSLTARPDAAYPDEGARFTVADWKIGEAGGSEDSLQLFSYALAAMKEFNCAPQDIDLYKVFLTDGTISKFPIDDRQMMRTKARIIQDVDKMRLLDPYGRAGRSGAFTPCKQPRVCAMCPFKEVCPNQ
jgi:hypothetical protein